MVSKAELRKKIKLRRAALNNELCDAKSRAICLHIMKHPIFVNAIKIGFYLAHGKEVDIDFLINKALSMNKECYAPVINPPGSLTKDKNMSFNRITGYDDLSHNLYGIREPIHSPKIFSWTLSCILLPLVAFDKQGNRLGMGGGFYDRTGDKLKTKPRLPKLIGVGYDFQLVNTVPSEKTDIKMDYVVTNDGWIRFEKI